MPIKLLHIINDLSIGGSEMMLYKLLSQMDRGMFEPVVCSLIDRGSLRERIEALNIQVFSAGMTPPLPSPVAVQRLRHLVRRIEPDLIHGWMYQGSLAALFVRSCSKQRARVLWGIFNSFAVPRNEKRMTAAVIRVCAFMSARPDGIIYNANQAQHEALGYRNKNNCVIPNGFDTSLFAPSQESRAEVRAELGVPDNAVLIGHIGRFHPSKDHSNFLRAAALLLRDYRDLMLVLCGTGVNSGNSSIKALADELGVGGKLLLLGERQDIPRLMTALDVLASSSSNEALPNVIGEAMSSGVPCVATDVGGVSWLLGETGIIAPPRNPEALAQALKKIIEMDHEGRVLLGKAARERIINSFSLESVVRQYESLYRKTLCTSVENCMEWEDRGSAG